MIKKDFKAYFVDLDGTLLNTDQNGNKYITKENSDAIKEFIEKGKDIVISTGRLMDFTLEYLNKVNIKYAVCGNGAQIIDRKGNILLEHDIPKKSLSFLKEIININDLSIKVNQTRKAFNVNSTFSKEIALKLKYQIFLKPDFSWEKNVYKIILWGKKEDELEKIIEDINKNIPSVFATSAERGLTIEVTHKNATKGKGNLWVAKNILKIKNISDNCVHIGDTMNDSSVLEYFQYFIAPINSEKKLLKISPYVGPSHHNNCVAKILKGEWWKNEIIKN